MPSFLAKFLVGFLSNKAGGLFTVRLGVKLLLANYGIVGFGADVISWFLRGVLGVFLDEGIFLLDLSLDSLREGAKLEEFQKQATAEYEKASKRVYTEAEKNAIRKEYLDIISKFGAISGISSVPVGNDT